MKIIAIQVLILIAFTIPCRAEYKTREQLFASLTDKTVNAERHFVEFDINGDKMNDILLSESVSLGGTGGLVYNLYIGITENKFKKIDQFLANQLALEKHGTINRLWRYSHQSSQSGNIQYFYFDKKGTYQKSQTLTIFTGDGGTDVGRRIATAIFNETTLLQTMKIK